MKWVGGAILLIVTIIFIVLAIFMFPWFTTKTEYNIETINDNNPDYWDDHLDGIEREWDETTYSLMDYEMQSSSKLDWDRDGQNDSTNSGKIKYDSSVKSGGWDGSYRDMAMEDYPVPGFLAGGSEQHNVYTYTYYMLLLSVILAVVGIILTLVAGLGKIKAIIPKILVGITIIFVVLAPLYFALALPPAISNDHEKLQAITSFGNQTVQEPEPPEGGSSIMGEANEKSEGGRVLSHITWGPELGWWLSIIAIFTCIITIAFIEGKAPPVSSTPDNMRTKYHEFDQRPRRRMDRGSSYEQEYIPPPSRRGRDDYYDDYGGGRDDYYDDYGSGYDYPPRRGPRRPPPPSQDYGRPPPRPLRRRPPPGY
ncbi:hypothetical protein [[Eubacterium] cellulosolvens]